MLDGIETEDLLLCVTSPNRSVEGSAVVTRYTSSVRDIASCQTFSFRYSVMRLNDEFLGAAPPFLITDY